MAYIAALGAVNALGNNLTEINQELITNYNAYHYLTEKKDWLLHDRSAWLGSVEQPLPNLPQHAARFSTRNNQLLYASYLQIEQQIDKAIEQYGHDRIAVIMGTSTSGIHEGDLAVKHFLATQTLPDDYHYSQQEIGDLSHFLTSLLDLKGPSYTISTACTSTARAIISGKRLIEADIVDAAIVGGADSLSRMPINGFYALESMADKPCMPFAKDRSGINIGEASALFLLTKEKTSDIAILGVGESSDAYHISAPHPDGLGAQQAMELALSNAQLTIYDIGYINLHGTATQLNDAAESKAVHRLFGQANTPCSSTKHLTGHTLGCAAATELALSYLLLNQQINLPMQNFSISERDPNLDHINLVTESRVLDKVIIMSNSFAFGGNNASLIIGRI